LVSNILLGQKKGEAGEGEIEGNGGRKGRKRKRRCKVRDRGVRSREEERREKTYERRGRYPYRIHNGFNFAKKQGGVIL
jgi:hypothetical protein